MANKHGIFPRGKVLYIRYYDPNLKKPVTKATDFPDTRQGWKDAKKQKDEITAAFKQQKRSLRFQGVPFSPSIAEAYKHYLKNNANKSAETIKEYDRFYRLYLTPRFPESLTCSKLTKLSVEDFLNDIKVMDLSQNTKYNICKNMKKFLSFLFEYGYIKNIFILNKDTVSRPETAEVHLWTDEDVRKLFDGLKDKTSNFRTAVYLLTFSGLRPVDLMLLKGSQIDIENSLMKYYSQKLKEWRLVPLHSELLPVLKERIEEVGKDKLIEYCELRALGKAFRKYLDDIGLKDKGYTLRTFRKYFETEAYDQDGDARAIAFIAGHSPQTADKYYRKFKSEKLKREIEKFQLPPEKKE